MALTQVNSEGIKDSEVKTADIADQAVDLTKLPHGDGTSNGKFLRSNNGADPTWETVTSSDTTYAISCVDGDNSDEEKIRLTAGGSGSGTDDVVLEAGTGLSIARDSDKITFTNTVTGGAFTLDGDNNIFAGTDSGNVGTWSGATNNFCVGTNAGTDLTSGDDNVLIGRNAGQNLTDAAESIAIGEDALATSTSNARTVAIGKEAFKDLNDGNNELVAIGNQAGANVTGGTGWTIMGGYAADLGVGTGADNTIIGYAAGRDITSGQRNTLIGSNCDDEITTGSYNTAVGCYAGNKIKTGSNNTAVGHGALSETEDATSQNTGIGATAGINCTSGAGNLFLGYQAGTSSSPSGAISTSSNNVVLGNDQIANLYCNDTSISSSDKRDKTDIADFTHGLAWIKKLKPITYRWDKRSWYNEYNEDGTVKSTNTPDGSKKTQRQHIGFLAQDVLDVEQSFGYAGKKDDMLTVNLNEDDTSYGMKYERLVPILVNAIKELEAKVAALEAK